MSFDYSKTGLPDRQEWKIAAAVCKEWLDQNMSFFGPERIANFMKDQPVAAAKLIMENCPDWTAESVTLALLGPAKGSLLGDEDVTRKIFGDRAVELCRYISGLSAVQFDKDMPKDAARLFLVEGLSTMNDQMIGRERIDRHHQTRWNILKDLESNFTSVKGQNPALDKIFEEALKKSRETLEALDKAATASNKAQKPPTM